MSFLEPSSLLNDRLCHLRSNRSTGDLTGDLTHCIGRSFQGYGESQILSLDIAKAFDRVSYIVLLSKLVSIVLLSSLVAYIRKYLKRFLFLN